MMMMIIIFEIIVIIIIIYLISRLIIGSHRLMGTYCTNINRIQQMNHTGQESILAVVRPVGYYKWSQGIQAGTTWSKSRQWTERDLNSGSPDLQSSSPTAWSHCLMIM